MDEIAKLLAKIFDQLMLTGKDALPHMVAAYRAEMVGDFLGGQFWPYSSAASWPCVASGR